MLEPITWNSYGEMTLLDGAREYDYVGVTRDIYDLVGRLCRQGRRGEAFQMLSGFTKELTCE